MRKDLLGLIKDQRDITNAVVLTHNIDFVYLQNLFLPALRRCGSPRLTVFADAQSASQTFALQAPFLSNLGRRYRVVAVAMEPGFRFHPKALLLSGRKKALLLVGSGNLTFGGWGENAEVWASYDSDESTSEIAAFRGYLDRLVASLALNHTLRSEIEEAFDPATRNWAKNLSEAAGLVGRLGTGPPLIEAIRQEVGPGPVDRLLVSTPYFDEAGEALQRLISALAPAETVVAIDPDHTNLRPELGSNTPAGVRFRSATVRRTSTTGNERRSFVHAKFYAVQKGDAVTLFLGSANCSRAALTVDGNRGNAELMAVRRFTTEDFTTQIVEEVEFGEFPPEFVLTPPEEDEEDTTPRPRLLAAREQDGLLEMAFFAPVGWSPDAVLIDGATLPLRQVEPCRCESVTIPNSRSARLRGNLGDRTIDTPPLWIDHEESLASSSYRRSLDKTAGAMARKAEWDVGDWGEVLEALCQDLEYFSPSRAMRLSHDQKQGKEKEDRTFSSEDLFARDLGLRLQAVANPLGKRNVSFQSILLQWFGHSVEDDDSMAVVDTNEDLVSDSIDGDPVDQPEPLHLRIQDREKRTRPKKDQERDRNRAHKIVDRMAATMSSKGYLESRQPGHLAQDLKLASLLLRMGRSKNWIDREHFLTITFVIWSRLFLSDGEKSSQGWLEKNGSDSKAFRDPLTSPDLAAALFAWSLEIPAEPATPRETQLLLSLALAVSRHPWLWVSSDIDALSSALADLLRAAEEITETRAIEARWRELILLGGALSKLEAALRKSSLQEFRQENHQSRIKRGEIIFQGALGFLIAEKAADRSPKETIPVLTLHGGSLDSPKFRADLLNPLAGLLDERDFLSHYNLQEAEIESLRIFASRLREGLADKFPEDQEGTSRSWT